MRIGVVGYGYWGPNIVRNFHALDNSEVVLVADRNPKCEATAEESVSVYRVYFGRERGPDLAKH